MTIDPKKQEQGKRLAEWNRQNELNTWKSESKLTLSLYYGIGAVTAVGALDIPSYYI